MCFMSLKILFTLAFCLFCFLQHGVQGGKIISQVEDDMEMENQLNALNRHPIKTLKTEDGDDIDCIDIYEQPSLNHPLLKNHKIQMRPTSVPKDLSVGTLSTTKNKYAMATPELVNCPTGTVPIRRTHKDDLIRAKSFSESFNRKIHPLTNLSPGKHLAIVRSVPNPKIKYKGVGAWFNVNDLTVGAKQSTFSQVWIEGGAPSVLNSLQTGWMIAPDLYGDSRSWSFIYWRGINNTGCFNYLCKGFVQVHKRYGIGVALKTSTWFDKVQKELAKAIFQDRETGHWWLRNIYANANIGYWPKELVPQLAQGASQVVWGGQTLGIPQGPSPPMGNGLFPHGNAPASYIRQMQIIDQLPNTFVDPAGPYYRTETFMDSWLCYKLDDYGYKGDDFRYSFRFGGPGSIPYIDCGK